jgi:DNA-binding transcriptional regulator YiaG
VNAAIFTQIRKELRRRSTVTQAELAARLNVHPMTVSRWERGERSIPGPVAVLMERMLKEAQRGRR